MIISLTSQNILVFYYNNIILISYNILTQIGFETDKGRLNDTELVICTCIGSQAIGDRSMFSPNIYHRCARLRIYYAYY